MLRNCQHCNNEFDAPTRDVNRGNGRFCSRTCGAKYRRANMPPTPPNEICALCSKPIYKNPSKRRRSRNGVYFCCREHKDIGQRIESNILDIHPPHYGTQNAYRRRALQHYPNKCNRCGYDRFVAVLHVHHIDRNRTNNELVNLEILCPTCHEIDHLLNGDGKYTTG